MIRCTCVEGYLVFHGEDGGVRLGDLSVEIFRKAVRHTKELAELTHTQVSTSVWLDRRWELIIACYPSRWGTSTHTVTLEEHRLVPLTKSWPLHTLEGYSNAIT